VQIRGYNKRVCNSAFDANLAMSGGGLKLGRLIQKFHVSCHGSPTDHVVRGSGIDQGDELLFLNVGGGAWKIRVSMVYGVYCWFSTGPTVRRLGPAAVVAPWPFPGFLRSSGQSAWK
jgi:hypothetical protein